MAAAVLQRRRHRTTRTFTNPLDPQGPDPWLTYYNGYYYLASTHLEPHHHHAQGRTLGGLAPRRRPVIFNLTRPNGAGTMWAPEFHLLNGPNGQRWYFYYTAGAEPYDLGTQRIHVLESAGLDPMGPYTFKADLLDPTQDNTWELDPSILQLNGQLYLLGTFYNGSQPMFIRPLSNPWTASGTRRILSTPDPTAGRRSAARSTRAPRSSSATARRSSSTPPATARRPDYKLGMLTYNGGDPLSSSSWVKSPAAGLPALQRQLGLRPGPQRLLQVTRRHRGLDASTTPTTPPAAAAT